MTSSEPVFLFIIIVFINNKLIKIYFNSFSQLICLKNSNTIKSFDNTWRRHHLRFNDVHLPTSTLRAPPPPFPPHTDPLHRHSHETGGPADTRGGCSVARITMLRTSSICFRCITCRAGESGAHNPRNLTAAAVPTSFPTHHQPSDS